MGVTQMRYMEWLLLTVALFLKLKNFVINQIQLCARGIKRIFKIYNYGETRQLRGACRLQ